MAFREYRARYNLEENAGLHYSYVQEHPPTLQFRPSSNGGGNQGGRAAICAKDQRLHQAVACERAVFNEAVDEISAASARLVFALSTTAAAKSREEEAARARARCRGLPRVRSENFGVTRRGCTALVITTQLGPTIA